MFFLLSLFTHFAYIRILFQNAKKSFGTCADRNDRKEKSGKIGNLRNRVINPRKNLPEPDNGLVPQKTNSPNPSLPIPVFIRFCFLQYYNIADLSKNTRASYRKDELAK